MAPHQRASAVVPAGGRCAARSKNNQQAARTRNVVGVFLRTLMHAHVFNWRIFPGLFVDSCRQIFSLQFWFLRAHIKILTGLKKKVTRAVVRQPPQPTKQESSSNNCYCNCSSSNKLLILLVVVLEEEITIIEESSSLTINKEFNNNNKEFKNLNIGCLLCVVALLVHH